MWVPENIHILPIGGHWKFRGGEGSQCSKFLQESIKLNWNFHRGGGVQSEKPSVGEIWIFSGTAHYLNLILNGAYTHAPFSKKG